jgi:hypothetical protein
MPHAVPVDMPRAADRAGRRGKHGDTRPNQAAGDVQRFPVCVGHNGFIGHLLLSSAQTAMAPDAAFGGFRSF